jgi:SAM-dependent methyltransferase
MVAKNQVASPLSWVKQNLVKPIKATLKPILVRNPALLDLLSNNGLIERPDLPQDVGMSYYQMTSSWGLLPDTCPCDIQFCEYLNQSGIMGQSIFHFGTGSHHIIGLENQQFDRPNQVTGITASLPEHQAYVQLVMQNPALAKFYKVIFADIYTLTASNLPTFDIVNLFHLCEFYLADNAAMVHHTDSSLVQLFLDTLRPDGRIIFYSGSRAWTENAQTIVQAFEDAGKIRRVDAYKNLLIYARSGV